MSGAPKFALSSKSMTVKIKKDPAYRRIAGEMFVVSSKDSCCLFGDKMI